MKKIIIILFWISGTVLYAQSEKIYSIENKKSIKYFEDAKSYYEARNDAAALIEIEKALAKSPEFIEAHLLLADIHRAAGKFQEAIDEYKKVIALNPKFFPKTHFFLGEIQCAIGQYQEAKENLEIVQGLRMLSPEMKAYTEKYLKDCNFAIHAMNNPVPFDPKNMGENINSRFNEYFPSITADGQTLLYTRDIDDKNALAGHQEDLFVSYKYKNEWTQAYNVGRPVNTPLNEGAPSIGVDGQLIALVACQEVYGTAPDGGPYYGPNRRGYGSCDIFYSRLVGKTWTEPRNIGKEINTRHWESQPSFSSDGRTMYFIRGLYTQDRVRKDQDIYMAQLNDEGRWNAPVKLSDKINTSGREESVYIHPDDQTLYFSSDGHVGMGGLDLFMCKRQEDGEWGEPMNLGYPINTHGNENSLLVSPDGQIAYFASDRVGGFGGLDLYQFELYEAARPEKITYVKGKVYDSSTKKPLGAFFELIDLQSEKLTVASQSNSGDGQFLVTLPSNKNYALNVAKEGYMFYSENFSLKELNSLAPYELDVPLQPIEEGGITTLKNVFFDTDKYDLKPESKVELNKLVEFLKKNPTVQIELAGHTDDVGDDKSNLTLSNNRAKSVKEYLVDNGVEAMRLTYKGYGESKPKVSNDSAKTRSVGSKRSIPFSFAFSMILDAVCKRSSSTIEPFVSIPPLFRNVLAMAPPMISLSTNFSIFSSASSLLDTFAPPMIATRGLLGFSTES